MRFSPAVTLAVLVATSAATVTSCGPSDDGECVTGERECACHPLGTCTGTLVCHQQSCVRANRATLTITGDGSRACEVVFREEGSTIAAVEFGSGVRGQNARRGNRASIAVISEGDTEVDGSRVVLRWLGNQDNPSLVVEQSRCFDRAGAPIPGSSVGVR